MISEGDTVPEFEIPYGEGRTLKSLEMVGKKYVLYFYPRDFTSGCTVEADEFSKLYPKFLDAGIRVIGVSPDTIQSHEKFCSKMGIPYLLLADTDKKLAKAFGVWGPKKFMGREYMGVNRSTFLVGEDSKIFRIFSRVKPKGHAEKVLECFTK